MSTSAKGETLMGKKREIIKKTSNQQIELKSQMSMQVLSVLANTGSQGIAAGKKWQNIANIEKHRIHKKLIYVTDSIDN